MDKPMRDEGAVRVAHIKSWIISAPWYTSATRHEQRQALAELLAESLGRTRRRLMQPYDPGRPDIVKPASPYP